MIAIGYRSPLHWPNTKDATKPSLRSQNSGFPPSMTLREAINYLEEEVQALSPQSATLYSNIEHINNDRLRKKLSNEPGVTLELKMAGKNYFLACDKWALIEHNIYALHLSVRGIRNMDKWGVASLDLGLYGFAAIKVRKDADSNAPDEGVELEHWMAELGLGPTATLEDAQAVYRRRAKALAGDEDALIALNNAMDEARKQLK